MTKEETEEYKMLVQRMVRRGLVSFKSQPAVPWDLKKEPKVEKVAPSVKVSEHFIKCQKCGKTVFFTKVGENEIRMCDHFTVHGTQFCELSGSVVAIEKAVS